MPVFDMIEAYAVKSLKYNPSTLLRVCVRTVFVGKLFTCLLENIFAQLENKLKKLFNCSFLCIFFYSYYGLLLL